MPRIVDHAQRRREIVIAVWALIARRGFEGVTLRAVATEANISVGRVQHYYASRTELVRDGCRLMLDEARSRFTAQIEPLPPVERLRALVRRAVPTSPEWALGTIVWQAYQAKTVDDAEIAGMVTEAHADAVRQAAAFIVAARRDGTLPDGGPPGDIALRLLATSEGYAARVIAGSLDADDALRALDRDVDALRGR
ncbi:TetR/AcrR family transcriptional regulator [Myceligenerans salitolerans]|uniref:TetR family transcriptional regulator n=1 Tax=Myceligenerans salitolerans TaxID=1230528 RepID=A0ABS3ICG7_9MICO|nr:TetR family transcriptional regulator [Myceligenerans salitolerans]MBO0610659.1 TetR family transcriptional regulator [Myceligenerans salitolerans]